MFRSVEGRNNVVTRIGLDGHNRVALSDTNAVEIMSTSPDGRWVTYAGTIGKEQIGVKAVPVYGGESKILCYNGCRPDWSPDGALLYCRTAFQPAAPALVVPLEPGRAFPEFPSGSADALSAWRTLPGARMLERPISIPGLDQATYIAIKVDERRNLFRVPLQR